MEATVTRVKLAKAINATVIMLRARRRAALRRPREARERCGESWRFRRRTIGMAARVEMSSREPAKRKAVAWGILLISPRISRPNAGRNVAMARMEMSSREPAKRKAVAWGILLISPRINKIPQATAF